MVTESELLLLLVLRLQLFLPLSETVPCSGLYVYSQILQSICSGWTCIERVLGSVGVSGLLGKTNVQMKSLERPVMMEHAFNPSIQEAKAG